MSAFQQQKQPLRRHIQDPGLLAVGYRIKKRKLPALKLQNSFFDGVLCNQLMLLGANGQRLHLSDGNGDAFGRYLLGYLCVGSDGALRFEEAAQLITDDYEVFSRNDAGYGEEQSLGYFDTLMKNSYEILSPLNRLTAEREMTSNCFLTADECVEQTTFGNVTITVNFGAQPYTCADGSVLPQYGFTVVSP